MFKKLLIAMYRFFWAGTPAPDPTQTQIQDAAIQEAKDAILKHRKEEVYQRKLAEYCEETLLLLQEHHSS